MSLFLFWLAGFVENVKNQKKWPCIVANFNQSLLVTIASMNFSKF